MKALGAVARPVAKPWYRGDAKGEPPMSASRKRSLKEPRCVPPMLSWLALRPRWLHATCKLFMDGIQGPGLSLTHFPLQIPADALDVQDLARQKTHTQPSHE